MGPPNHANSYHMGQKTKNTKTRRIRTKPYNINASQTSLNSISDTNTSSIHIHRSQTNKLSASCTAESISRIHKQCNFKTIKASQSQKSECVPTQTQKQLIEQKRQNALLRKEKRQNAEKCKQEIDYLKRKVNDYKNETKRIQQELKGYKFEKKDRYQSQFQTQEKRIQSIVKDRK